MDAKKFSILDRLTPRMFAAIISLAALTASSAAFLFTVYVRHKFPNNLNYNFYSLRLNYFSAGFVRRGLPGTLASLLGAMRQPQDLIIWHIVLTVWLAIPAIILLLRLWRVDQRVSLYLGLVLVASPQLFLAWGLDVGRSDMFTAGCLAWTLIAVLDRRYLLGCFALIAGSLAHEMALIFGLPLYCAFAYLQYRVDRKESQRIVAALAIMVLSLIAIAVIQHIFGASSGTIARIISAEKPTDQNAQWASTVASYFAAGGLRTLISSACMSFARPSVYFIIFAGFFVFGLYAFVLFFRTRLALCVLAFTSLMPMVVMTVIAVDYGRWLSLAVMSAWLVSIALRLNAPSMKYIPSRHDYRSGLIALGLLLLMGPGKVEIANAATEGVAKVLWPHATVYLLGLDNCDPTWRSSITELPSR